MRTEDNADQNDDLRDEYDFEHMSGGVQGKYVERYRSGTNIVVLDPDVAEAFPTSEAVNDTLRMILKIAATKPKSKSRRHKVA